jgi:hypothetical protein
MSALIWFFDRDHVSIIDGIAAIIYGIVIPFLVSGPSPDRPDIVNAAGIIIFHAIVHAFFGVGGSIVVTAWHLFFLVKRFLQGRAT